MLQPKGLQRVRHNLVNEQQQKGFLRKVKRLVIPNPCSAVAYRKMVEHSVKTTS